ncbi:MAG: hypothetical protein WC810_23225 [Janthinobacterium sp.]|jgi:hypothetical protein
MKITGFEVFRGRVMSIDKEITKKDLATLAVLVAAATIITPGHALAAEGDIADRVAKASQPIKDMLLGIADPVCYIVFVWGLLETMLGKGTSGLTRMKYAALGYMGMNWLPLVMELLRNAKP